MGRMLREDELLGPETAEQVMHLALEHYVKHYNVVMLKLGHARSATRQGMEESSSATEKESMRDYDAIWTNIIEMFRSSGVAEEELRKVEAVLARIPALIRRIYDLRVEQDETLQTLMKELESEDYRQALALTRKIQARRDALSGLEPREFDIAEAVHALMIPVPRTRDHLH